jgi:phospholipase/carboxylesterase
MTTDSFIHAQSDGAAHKPGGPLFFAFHGTGGNENQFTEFAANAVPEARIIAPRGAVQEGGATRYFRRTGEGIYDFDDLWRRTQDMAAFMQAHIDAAKPSAVVALGYSNGANILAAVMDKHPGLIHHAVMMHPLVTWDMAQGTSLSGTTALITAGGRDPICPPDKTGALADSLDARGADVSVWWHPGGHDVPESETKEVTSWLNDLRATWQGHNDLVIQREDDGKKGRWFIRANSGHEAEMTYTWAKPGTIIIDHTQVPDVFKGQGLAHRLYREMVSSARKEGFLVVPLCPYAAAQFKRHPEDGDVLDKTIRVKAG